MNYSVFRFTLNMHTHRSQASVPAFLGDTAVRLLINLTDGGNTYFIEDGCTAVLSGTKADGKPLCNRCVILNNRTIQYDFTEQTTSWAGVVNCELTIYGADGMIVTAPKFVIVVEEREAPNLDDITSSEERTALDAIFGAEGARVAAEEARAEADHNRAIAENLREEEEGRRSTAETLRYVNEKQRDENEQGRDSAEKARAEAETLRDSAEKAREEAEEIRKSAFTDLSALVDEIRGEVETVEETLVEINEGGIEA